MNRDREGRNAAYGVMTFLVLGVVVPILAIDRDLAAGGFNAVLSLSILEISAVRLAVLIADGKPRLLWLGAHLFIYPFLGVATLVQTTSMAFPLNDQFYNPGMVTGALTTVLLGLLAFELGAMAAPKVRTPTRTTSTSYWTFSQHRVIILAFVGLAFLASALATSGLSPFFASREDATAALAGITDNGRAYALESKTGFLLNRIGVRIPIFIALLAMLAMIRQGKWEYGRLGRPATHLLLVIVIVANLIANNPISNSRFWFGTVLLGILGVFMRWRQPAGFRGIALGALGTFLLAFGFLDYFRRSSSNAVQNYSPRTNYITDGSYSGFQTVMNGEKYLTGGGDHTWGQQLLGALGTFVPRSVWGGKPQDTGQLIDPLYNRAATLWTEFEVDFTRVGMVVAFLCIGVAIVRIEARLDRDDLAAALLLPMLAGVAIFTLRGSLVSAMGTIYPLLFIYRFALHREKSPVMPTRRAAKPVYRSVAPGHH